MIPEPNPRLESALGKFSKVASAGVGLAGAAVLVGRRLEISFLKCAFSCFVSGTAGSRSWEALAGFQSDLKIEALHG